MDEISKQANKLKLCVKLKYKNSESMAIIENLCLTRMNM